MLGRKAIIGLTVLCALLVSAFAAQAASAAGTTAYTCASVGEGSETTKGFSDEHCKVAAANDSTHKNNVKREHVEIPLVKENAAKTEKESEVTNITGSDITTGATRSGAVLKATIAGSAIELVAKEVSGTGTMQNKEIKATGEMYAHGEGVITYKEVTENLLGCVVTGYKNGVKGAEKIVETNQLTATTAPTATIGDKLKFQPKEAGTPFAEFELTGCIIGPLRVKVFGTVLGVPDGATTNTVHNTVTTEKTLRLQNATTGPVAGIEGTLTIKSGSTPLSVTT